VSSSKNLWIEYIMAPPESTYSSKTTPETTYTLGVPLEQRRALCREHIYQVTGIDLIRREVFCSNIDRAAIGQQLPALQPASYFLE
jgi:hypothetical protein